MPRTALVVDDSMTMRQMVAFVLGEAGFSVLEGSDGEEGVQHLTGQRIDVIITDLNMPVMDGIAFIREVRSRAAYRFTPILMLTTESQEARKREGRAAGATGWIVKPFDPVQLVQVVNRVLR